MADCRAPATITIAGFRTHFKYLSDWRDRPLGELRKSLARERIAKRTGDPSGLLRIAMHRLGH